MTEPCKAGFYVFEQVVERCDKPTGHDGKHTATGINPDTGRKKRVAWEDIKVRQPARRTDFDDIDTTLRNSNFEAKP